MVENKQNTLLFFIIKQNKSLSNYIAMALIIFKNRMALSIQNWQNSTNQTKRSFTPIALHWYQTLLTICHSCKQQPILLIARTYRLWYVTILE